MNDGLCIPALDFEEAGIFLLDEQVELPQQVPIAPEKKLPEQPKLYKSKRQSMY